jgi:hypothetical protein
MLDVFLDNVFTHSVHAVVRVQVAATFRKTAANFHYEFNIRHLSNVFQVHTGSLQDIPWRRLPIRS